MSVSRHARRLSVLSMLALSLAAGCSLDQRRLSVSGSAGFWVILAGTETGGDGSGSSAAGSGSGGTNAGSSGTSPLGTADAGEAGTTGQVIEPDHDLVEGCPDLDLNGVADCQETLAQNPRFAADASHWSATGDVLIEWSPINALTDEPSGSGRVSVHGALDMDGDVLRAATQCVPVGDAQELDVYASALVKSGQGEGEASLGIFSFSTDDCSGSPLGLPLDVPTVGRDIWQTIGAHRALPPMTASVLVRLGVSKPFRSPRFDVYFDNVLLRLK